jgi:hypothetical protein
VRNEVEGYIRISHWVEHILFKGTVSLDRGAERRNPRDPAVPLLSTNLGRPTDDWLGVRDRVGLRGESRRAEGAAGTWRVAVISPRRVRVESRLTTAWDNLLTPNPPSTPFDHEDRQEREAVETVGDRDAGPGATQRQIAT